MSDQPLPSHLAIGTIVAGNFLAHARVLARSLHAQHPDVPVFVLLADEPPAGVDLSAEPFQVVHLRELGIPHLERFLFSHTLAEAAIAAKPFLLAHLLDRGFPHVLFLDPDTLALGPLTPLLQHVAAHAVTLVPHLLHPLTGPDCAARELNILLSGTFNGGCLGVSQGPAARQFLTWWQQRLRRHWWSDVPAGLHHDQRWLDLVPVFVEGVGLFRDASCNVAHWNLPERDASSCYLFHFSGFDPATPEVVTRYNTRLAMPTLGPAAELFARYTRLLHEAGHADTRALPYAWATFDNGAPITDAMRRRYRAMGDEAARFGNPFVTGRPNSAFAWLGGQR